MGVDVSDSLGVTGFTGDFVGDFGVLDEAGETRGLARLGKAVKRFLLCGPDVTEVLAESWTFELLDDASLL